MEVRNLGTVKRNLTRWDMVPSRYSNFEELVSSTFDQEFEIAEVEVQSADIGPLRRLSKKRLSG